MAGHCQERRGKGQVGTRSPCLKCVMDTIGLNFETESIPCHSYVIFAKPPLGPAGCLQDDCECVYSCTRRRRLPGPAQSSTHGGPDSENTKCVLSLRGSDILSLALKGRSHLNKLKIGKGEGEEKGESKGEGQSGPQVCGMGVGRTGTQPD